MKVFNKKGNRVELAKKSYVDVNFTHIKSITKKIPGKNQYEQLIEALKENHNTYNAGSYIITVEGGTYFVIGNQNGSYGGYLAFSYWDNVVHIRDFDGVWYYTVK